MGKTISAFFQFVLDDPIMLGLCIAILALIIVFIIVLFLGKRADKKEEKLLKTEIDLSKMTEETSITPDTSSADVSVQPIDTMEVPATIEEEPQKLEFAAEKAEQPKEEVAGETVSIPAPEHSLEDALTTPEESFEEVFNTKTEVPTLDIPSFDDFRIEAPTAEEMKEITGELNLFDAPVPTIESTSKTPVVEETTDKKIEDPVFDVSDYIFEPAPSIVESAINPVDETDESADVPSLSEQLRDDYTIDEIALPTAGSASPKEVPVLEETKKEESPEDIYSYDVELPEINVEDFSRTTLIRHIPVLDMNTNFLYDDENSSKDDLSDLDLPKLNGNTDTSNTFSSLKGESFDIPKNS